MAWIKSKRDYEKAMLKIHEGTIEGRDVAVLFSGVCKVNAAIATQILIDLCGCDMIIVSGTAGGIDERLSIYDTVISTEVAYHDVAAGILTQFHPWMESEYFHADDALIELAERAARKVDISGVVYTGRIVTGEKFIEKDTYPFIQKQYAPLCVDMETASVAHVCYVNEIPFTAIRTITDIPRIDDAQAFEVNCEHAARVSAEIVKMMLRMIDKD